jgi:hypothetical protein
MKDFLKRFNIKLFMFNNKFQDVWHLTEFVGKSPTADCAKHLHQDQTKSDFYYLRQC